MGRKKSEISVSVLAEGDGENPIGLEKIQQSLAVSKYNEKYIVQKVKLKDLFPEVDYSERTSDGTNDVHKSCSAPVHDDLKTAFSRLDSHLTVLCNQYDENGSFNHKECYTTGFSVNNDNTGVVLIGRRNFEDGGINLVSPLARFEDHGDVEHILELIKQEVLLYLFEGKHAPDAQLSLFDEADGDFAE